MTPFSANSTCAERARVSGASRMHLTASSLLVCCCYRAENAWSVLLQPREDTTKCRLQPVQLLPSIPAPEPVWGVVVAALLLLSCHIHRGAYVTITSPAWRGASSLLHLCCWCLLVAHTYQAILVLSPKLTNAPTKVHTGCLAHWDSGVCIHAVQFCYVQCIICIAG